MMLIFHPALDITPPLLTPRPPFQYPAPKRGGELNVPSCLQLGWGTERATGLQLGKGAEPGGNQLPSHCRGGVSAAGVG